MDVYSCPKIVPLRDNFTKFIAFLQTKSPMLMMSVEIPPRTGERGHAERLMKPSRDLTVLYNFYNLVQRNRETCREFGMTHKKGPWDTQES